MILLKKGILKRLFWNFNTKVQQDYDIQYLSGGVGTEGAKPYLPNGKKEYNAKMNVMEIG